MFSAQLSQCTISISPDPILMCVDDTYYKHAKYNAIVVKLEARFNQ